MNVLFVSWDGPYVTYIESLFLPILAGFNGFGLRCHILHFSLSSTATVERIGEECERQGVPYRHVRILIFPHPVVGKLLTLMAGRWILRNYIDKNEIKWVIPRTMMPASMVLGIRRKFPDLKIIFDADGLPIEERVDFAGLRPGSLRHKQLKRIERQIISVATRVLTRSHKATEFLVGQYGQGEKFFKVLNGRRESLYGPVTEEARAATRKRLGIPSEALLVVYTGSLGAPYCVDEMIELQRQILRRDKSAWLLLITGNPGYFETPPLEQMIVIRVTPPEVAELLGAADLGLALRKPEPSMAGVSPVKLGEYLLTGLPVIASAGIGDTEEILSGKDYAFILRNHDPDSLEAAANWATTVTRKSDPGKIREANLSYFGLEASIASYASALAPLISVSSVQ